MFILRLLIFSVLRVHSNKYAPDDSSGGSTGTDEGTNDDSGSGDAEKPHPNDRKENFIENVLRCVTLEYLGIYFEFIQKM